MIGRVPTHWGKKNLPAWDLSLPKYLETINGVLWERTRGRSPFSPESFQNHFVEGCHCVFSIIRPGKLLLLLLQQRSNHSMWWEEIPEKIPRFYNHCQSEEDPFNMGCQLWPSSSAPIETPISGLPIKWSINIIQCPSEICLGIKFLRHPLRWCYYHSNQEALSEKVRQACVLMSIWCPLL